MLHENIGFMMFNAWYELMPGWMLINDVVLFMLVASLADTPLDGEADASMAKTGTAEDDRRPSA